MFALNTIRQNLRALPPPKGAIVRRNLHGMRQGFTTSTARRLKPSLRSATLTPAYSRLLGCLSSKKRLPVLAKMLKARVADIDKEISVLESAK